MGFPVDCFERSSRVVGTISWRDIKPMRFRQVVPGLFKANRSNINVYAIKDGPSVTLIHCGEPHFADDILSACDELGQIETIIVTHAHRDYAGSLAEIAKATGAKISRSKNAPRSRKNGDCIAIV